MATPPEHPTPQSGDPLDGPRFDFLLREYLVGAMSASIAQFDNLGRASLFAAVARTCGPFAAEPGRHHRRISVNALASSLSRPFETARRTANSLIEAGLLVRIDAGLQVAPAALEDARVIAFGERCHDLLVNLIVHARAANLALPPTRPGVTYDVSTGTGIAFDMLLAAIECRGGDERSLMRMALLTTVAWASQRDIDVTDHAATPTPVRPSTIARLLGLPYATAARNLDTLARDGFLVRHASGLCVDPTAMQAPQAIEARQAIGNRARQLIGRLAQAGFPMEAPASAYINAHPPQPALG